MTGPCDPSSSRPPESGDARATLPLVTLDEPERLRADAARNRTLLLEAASRLMAGCGATNLTMESVAAAAGVGKGTVFRRFGDRTGLLIALMDHREGLLQAAFLSGPPPMGPGAPAVERLHAFGPAVIRHEREHHELILASRADPLRTYAVPATRLRVSHVAMLLRQAHVAGHPELLAHTLLGSIDAALVRHLTTDRGMSIEQLDQGWHDLVSRLGARP
ncbi:MULTISPECIES: TetR/AcrR family transcriptional regulator [unclassified Streptomyces]|uniref:TetR/AcrR family transcriptional regulator n=1 Tax=Streptomyces TaxID=1883 RepID=UPI0001C1A2DB|nr:MULTISPECIES: TetR/AcrR family transcriptional regulator [unclassified Streptomyces]AEN10910.1 transcriptional regulator, TetR family [Streptomyces sp. SirexAA-E]MYR69313.1 TetR family transcriptional regulator [Streptomyces sp. SID4939]MYS01105.1 TetR family transcriptional regulator [Streptomyces sp. SID4940]MYT63821.1 TetR family transcriptional regulator [Streptomyces sp. SID8357]MYT86071.1 TetR family transcriptional regulator [Streptomyces sp. SID8360]